LANQPGFLTRHMLLSFVENALWRAVGNPDTQCGKACRQPAFCAATPTDRLPACRSQDRLCGDREGVGDRMLTRTAMTGDGKDQSDIMGIDLLMFGDADRPGEAASTQPLAEGRRQAVACVSQHCAKP